MSSALKRLVLAAALLVCASGAIAQETQSRSVIRLSYIPGNFALPVLVGIEHGLFAKEGLFLSTIPITDEATIMRSLAAGGTDFAIGSQAMLLSIAENKADAKVVAVAGYGREIDLVVPVWDTTTKSLADIKGKAVLLLNGVHNFDAVPELYRALALSKPPMRLSDVTIQFVDIANLHNIFDPRFRNVYVQRKVGGVFMLREFSAFYVEEKKARVVLSNDDVTKLVGRVGAQPLFASKRVIEKEPQTVERFVRGWARTLQYISTPGNREAIVRVLQIYYLRQYGVGLKAELADQYISRTKYDRLLWGERDLAEVIINARALSAARNLLFARIKEADKRPFKTVPPVADFIDMSFAKKAIADLQAEHKAAAAKPVPPADAKPAAPDTDKKAETPPAEKKQNADAPKAPDAAAKPETPPAKADDKPAAAPPGATKN